MPISESKFFRLLRERNFKDAHALLDEDQSDSDPGHAEAERQHARAHFRLAAFNCEGRYAEALDHLDISLEKFLCKTTAFSEKARILVHLGRVPDAKKAIDNAPFEVETKIFPGLVDDAKFLKCYIYLKLGEDISDLIKCLPDDFKSVLPDDTGIYASHLSLSDLKHQQTRLRQHSKVRSV